MLYRNALKLARSSSLISRGTMWRTSASKSDELVELEDAIKKPSVFQSMVEMRSIWERHSGATSSVQQEGKRGANAGGRKMSLHEKFGSPIRSVDWGSRWRFWPGLAPPRVPLRAASSSAAATASPRHYYGTGKSNMPPGDVCDRGSSLFDFCTTVKLSTRINRVTDDRR